MYNHEPPGYDCPFCREDPLLARHPLEILRHYDEVTVRLNPRWLPGHHARALVIPNAHHENVFDLPAELGAPLQRAVRDTAVALKRALRCEGVSTRQHNEPAGDQDVWHYHVHVLPRFAGDDPYSSRGEWAGAAEMAETAEGIRAAWPE